jgi:hypothetical protein
MRSVISTTFSLSVFLLHTSSKEIVSVATAGATTTGRGFSDIVGNRGKATNIVSMTITTPAECPTDHSS